jgi:hypothetical protein
MNANGTQSSRPALPHPTWRHVSRPAADPRQGQAIVEFLAGLVAILVLTGFMIQLASLGRVQQDTMTQARQSAGRLALGTIAVPDTPDYIRHWEPGPDTRTYSRDDTFTHASQGNFLDDYTDPIVADPADAALMGRLPHNPIGDLGQMTTPVNGFGLFSRSETKDVELLPVVRHLLYRAESITVESEVWMPTVFGIY